ncbi:hypothetical protein BOX15_Mlig002167g4, partial [Macrostomum lignano]
QRQLELVSLERQEEMAAEQDLLKSSARALQDKGLALHKIYLASQATGMYGRRVLEFETYQRAKDLPSHSIAPGDIVGIFHSQQEQQQIGSGIVTKVLARAVCVAMETDQASSAASSGDGQLEVGYKYSVVKLGSDVTFKRLKKGLLALLQKPPSLADLLLGERSLAPTRDLPPPSGESTAASSSSRGVSYFNPHLDESQRAAVELGLRRSDLVMIHGPPGTGKTTTVVELVRQLVARGERLLCCAPSNTAVDNLAERLIASGVRCVRLGHPARQLPQVVEHSLDALLARSEDRRIIADVRADIDKLLSGGRNRRIGAELHNLRSELRQREANCVKAILTRAQAVLCTLTVGGLNDDSTLKEIQFDATVIDECSQATEAACWLALPRAPKCILAGDPYQLPPTVRSERAVAAGFAVTLMERLLPRSAEATQLLTVQYRMHRDIMLWSSEAFYSNQLISHESVAGHRLADLPGFAAVSDGVENDDEFPPLLLVDTAGCDLAELESDDSEMSKANPGEAAIVAEHVSALVTSGLAPSDIAVISPYNLQVEHIRLALQQQQQQQSTPSSNLQSVEVRSVDGFQGREKEAVIISLVRSNRKGIVGFLSEHRRLNVAVTRARRHLCVIGDCDTVGRGDSVLAGFVQYLLTNAKVRSASEFAHVLDDIVMASPSQPSAGGQSQKQQQKRGNNKKQQKLDKEAKEARIEQLINVIRLLANSSLDNLSSAAAAVGVAFVLTEDGGELRFLGLNPYERARLHEECERIGGLQHRSVDEDAANSAGEGGGRVLLVSKVSGATADKTATESDKMATESDKMATESDKTATESDKAATESDKMATESEKMATESDKAASGSDKMATESEKMATESDKAASGSDKMASESDKMATESDKMATESDKTATESDKAATESDKMATESEKMATESDKAASGSDKMASESDKMASESDKMATGSDQMSAAGNAKVNPLSSGPVANEATDCPVCGKPVPPGNAELHRVACDWAMRNRQLRAAVDGASAAVESGGAVGGKKGSQKKTGDLSQLVVLGVASNQKSDGSAIKKQQANKKKQQAEAVDNNTEEDFDALLAEFAAMDSVCGYPDCKTPVRTVGHGCAHCRRRYCFSHFVPEVHGCGQAAERQPGESLPVRLLPVLWRRQNPTGRLCDGPSCIAGWRRGWTTWSSQGGRRLLPLRRSRSRKLAIKRRTRRNDFYQLLVIS